MQVRPLVVFDAGTDVLQDDRAENHAAQRLPDQVVRTVDAHLTPSGDDDQSRAFRVFLDQYVFPK